MTFGKGAIMDYIYFLANASLTLRVIEHISAATQFSTDSMTVIHRIDGWIVKIKFCQPLTPQEDGNFKAFLSELGISYEPDIRLQMVFWSLETGQSPIDVMRRYQVAIVSHGNPNKNDIEAFRKQFTKGLGYCPETLA